MTLILPERRNPGFKERLLSGAGSAAQQGSQLIPQMLMGRQENETIKNLTGQDVSGLSPDLKKTFFEKSLGQKENKQQNLHQISSTLDRMESLIPESGIGMSGALNPSDKASFNRGEFSSLQASLIPLFKQMFPRMTNYDLKIIQDNYIPNASDREETIRGKIQGLRRMLETGEIPAGVSQGTENGNKIKFNPQHPEHKAKATQLHKRLKDKEKVRKELEREFEF